MPSMVYKLGKHVVYSQFEWKGTATCRLKINPAMSRIHGPDKHGAHPRAQARGSCVQIAPGSTSQEEGIHLTSLLLDYLLRIETLLGQTGLPSTCTLIVLG